uniref:Uncharacterized protein n=1 Tax=Sphaerodactylus townsendi TaxID=933632 RepID=A0ACB8EY13_9SAUR
MYKNHHRDSTTPSLPLQSVFCWKRLVSPLHRPLLAEEEKNEHDSASLLRNTWYHLCLSLWKTADLPFLLRLQKRSWLYSSEYL